MQLKALRAGPGPVVLLLYASGGRSCPEACHRIREAYVNLASHSKQAVAAVQCKRRQGHGFSEYVRRRDAKQLPFDQIPTLRVGDTVLGQSCAIARYAAKLAKLYPEDALSACKADAVVDAWRDQLDLLYDTFFERTVIAEKLQMFPRQQVERKCAEFADKLPAVLFFAKGNRPEKVLSTGTSLSYSLLQKKVAKADVNDMELTAGDFEGGDPCGGQFCLLLLHRGKGDSVPLEKKDLKRDGIHGVRNEPVKVYRVSAEKHPAFARAFEGFVGLLRRPAVRLVLYRPKRRSFQSYEGATDSAESVVDFVQKAISRGSQLPEKLSVLPVIQ
eukprot:g25902.t2